MCAVLCEPGLGVRDVVVPIALGHDCAMAPDFGCPQGGRPGVVQTGLDRSVFPLFLAARPSGLAGRNTVITWHCTPALSAPNGRSSTGL
jgi:hypothetical protein